jgi:hypothetical protein
VIEVERVGDRVCGYLDIEASGSDISSDEDSKGAVSELLHGLVSKLLGLVTVQGVTGVSESAGNAMK